MKRGLGVFLIVAVLIGSLVIVQAAEVQKTNQFNKAESPSKEIKPIIDYITKAQERRVNFVTQHGSIRITKSVSYDALYEFNSVIIGNYYVESIKGLALIVGYYNEELKSTIFDFDFGPDGKIDAYVRIPGKISYGDSTFRSEFNNLVLMVLTSWETGTIKEFEGERQSITSREELDLRQPKPVSRITLFDKKIIIFFDHRDPETAIKYDFNLDYQPVYEAYAKSVELHKADNKVKIIPMNPVIQTTSEKFKQYDTSYDKILLQINQNILTHQGGFVKAPFSLGNFIASLIQSLRPQTSETPLELPSDELA